MDEKNGSFLYELCRNYFNDKEQELEMRITIDESLFSDLYNRILKSELSGDIKIENSKIIQSIAFITNEKNFTSRRAEIFYEKGVKKNESYILKKSSMKPFMTNLYKLSLAKETPIDTFNYNNVNVVRIKLRSAITFESKKYKFIRDWAFHFTLVYRMGNDSESIKKSDYEKLEALRNKLITGDLKVKNFLDLLNTEGIHLFPEFEIEYSPKKSQDIDTMVQSIKGMIDLVKTWLTPAYENVLEYQHEIYSIAERLIKDRYTLGGFRSRNGLKNLVNQPLQLTNDVFKSELLPNIDKYFLSNKIDGERVLVKMSNEPELKIILAGEVLNLVELIKDPKKLLKYTLVDAEYIPSTSKSSKSSNSKKDSSKNKSKEKSPRIFIFDVLYYDGNKMTQLPFQEREKLLDKIALVFNEATNIKCERKIMIPLSKDPKDKKNYYKKQIEKVFNMKFTSTEIDGLIFTPFNSINGNKEHVKYKYGYPDDYFDMKVYKWKPPEKSTIDFLILKAPDSLLGKKPFIKKKGKILYLLFCGIKKNLMNKINITYMNDYKKIISGIHIKSDNYPIQFSPSSNPNAYLYYAPDSIKDIHGKVGEFVGRKRNADEMLEEDKDDIITQNEIIWELVKMRPDKDIEVQRGVSYGNSFRTAELIYDTYAHPLTLEMLISEPSSQNSEIQYFQQTKSPMYIPPTKLNAFVKFQLMKQLEGKDWILDLASGKGNDLFIYDCLRIKNGIFIDIDASALNELNNRKYSLGDSKFYVFCDPPNEHIKVYTVESDTTVPYSETLMKLKNISCPITQSYDSKLLEQSSKNNKIKREKRDGVDAVIINFAIHYMIHDKESLTNIINLVDKSLKSGGIFIFTCFDGSRVFDLLKKTQYKKSWDIHQDNALKYSIKKKYKNDKFTDFGLQIGVVHPFSKGEYYDENLLGIERVIKEFEKNGYKLHQYSSFGDWIPKFKQFDKRFGELLTDDDEKYVSLYSYVSLYKK